VFTQTRCMIGDPIYNSICYEFIAHLFCVFTKLYFLYPRDGVGWINPEMGWDGLIQRWGGMETVSQVCR